MSGQQLSIFDKPEKVTQKIRIFKYMQDYGSITPVEALRDLGVMRLAARIADLEGQGIRIVHERETATNRMGEKVSYSRYRLEV